MTVAKVGLLTAALIAVVALGIVTGPTIRDHWSRMNAADETTAAPAAGAPAPARAERPARGARSSSSRAHARAAVKESSNTIRTIPVSVWEPEFRDRVKAVLNPGARIEIAAADFDNAEQFMTVAHAARNTEVPFMVLKDRVLNRGQSLAEAIHEFKPGLNAKAEVTRARAAARSDLEIAG
jgi:hypothetical protein